MSENPIRAWRKQNGKSLVEFAAAIGCATGKLSEIENDKIERISAETVVAIERATGGAIRRHELRPDLWDKPNEAAE